MRQTWEYRVDYAPTSYTPGSGNTLKYIDPKKSEELLNQRGGQACQSNIANLRMLKLSLAVATNKNPLGHLSPQTGGSRTLEAPMRDAIKSRREKQSVVARTQAATYQRFELMYRP
jgi:hypothetical protein